MMPYDQNSFSELYKLANHNGITPTLRGTQLPIIPSPNEITMDNLDLIKERLSCLKEYMSPSSHEQSTNTKTAAPQPYAQNREHEEEDPKELFVTFINNPLSPGVRVPAFGVLQNGTLQLMENYSFLKTENAGHTICLTRRGTNGLPETARISKTHYDHIIQSATIPAASQELSPEIIKHYKQEVSADVDATRPNTATNFWHNYRVLACKEALNPVDAARIARRIYSGMKFDERIKFDASISAYEKERNESYNTRINRFYEEVVKNKPIKNRTPHDGASLVTMRHNDDSIDTKGKPIDAKLRLKIGDPVKLTITLPDFVTFGELKKLKTDLYLASSSENLNKVVLMSRDNTSKYTIPRDQFINNMLNIERRNERLQARDERRQFKKSVRESIGFGY
jgi:hypothetical protein